MRIEAARDTASLSFVINCAKRVHDATCALSLLCTRPYSSHACLGFEVCDKWLGGVGLAVGVHDPKQVLVQRCALPQCVADTRLRAGNLANTLAKV